MESIKIENQSLQSEGTPEELLVETVTDSYEKVKCDDRTLKRVVKHLSRLQKKKKMKCSSKKVCSSVDLIDLKVDRQITLKCRQLPDVVEELRRAVMRQDWDEATTLLMVMCHPGLNYYSTIIIRVCFILLLSHPNSGFTLLQQFVRLASEYILEEDVNKFIRILFALRKDVLGPLESGKYIRKTGDYKVVKDIEFEKL